MGGWLGGWVVRVCMGGWLGGEGVSVRIMYSCVRGMVYLDISACGCMGVFAC